MFNWVCPNCGKDIPPSKTECPYCAELAKESGAAQPVGQPVAQETAYPGWQQPPAPQTAWTPPPAPPQTQTWTGWQPTPAQPAAPPPPQQWQPAPEPPRQAQQWNMTPPEPPRQEPARPDAPRVNYAPPTPSSAPPQFGQPHNWGPPPAPPGTPPPPPGHGHHPPQGWQVRPPAAVRPGLPTWALTVIFALVFLAIGAIVYFGIQRFSRTNPAEKAGLQEPAASAGKVTNPLQKYVEVVGIRMFDEKNKPAVRFVVVNHSNTEINNLGGNVTLWASTSRSEEDAVGTFAFRAGTLGPEESKELTEPLKTKLKIYELPDWQNATAELSITSPQP